jgi:hypothetical protein
MAAFGARIVVEVLPDFVEHRPRNGWLGDDGIDNTGSLERPVRIRVVGRERVSGPVLVELDNERAKVVAAFAPRQNVGGGE